MNIIGMNECGRHGGDGVVERRECLAGEMPVKGGENMSTEKYSLDKEQEEGMVMRKNTNSEVLLHHRLPRKGEENMVMVIIQS